MALIGEQQVRNFFLVNTSTQTTAAGVRGGAVENGAIVSADGTAAADNEEFYLAVQNYKGEMTASDVVNPGRVMYAKTVPYVAQTFGVDTISALTVDAGSLYQVAITFSGYGSLSVENEYVKKAFYKAKTGDDQEDIVDGLIKSLARNFSREQPASNDTFTYTLAGASTVELPDNLFFTFAKTGSGASSALVITEKSDWLAKYYVTGKKTRLYMDYKVSVRFETDPTIVSTKGFPGVGTGYEVRNLEEYLLGNRQDTFRGAGYPHNFEEVYRTSLTATYNLIEIGYFDEGRDDPMKSKKQITIAVPFTNLASNATTNTIIGQLNTALTSVGISLSTLPVV